MIRLKHVRFISGEEQETIYVISDTHIGHRNSNLKLLRKHIDLIKETQAPWLHLGDWVDAISPDDRRFSIEDHRDSVVASYDISEDMFKPIMQQNIAILRGNHGSKWSKREGDELRRMAKRHNIQYLGYCGFVTVKLKGKSYKIWLHHGAGGGRKRGAKTIRLNDWSQFVEADLYLQGHTHTYVAFPDTKLTTSKKRLRWYANAPGYIDSYTGHDNYVEEFGLPPQPPGMMKITLGDYIKISAVLE